jgi:hypothetical protein
MMAIAFLLLGAFIVAVNLHTSFFRKLLHDRLHPGQPYHFASGIPLFGSIILGIAWWLAPPGSFTSLIAPALILLDTGGPHWLIYAMIRGRNT